MSEQLADINLRPGQDLYRRLVPAKFVYVLVRMSYFLAVKYKRKL